MGKYTIMLFSLIVNSLIVLLIFGSDTLQRPLIFFEDFFFLFYLFSKSETSGENYEKNLKKSC